MNNKLQDNLKKIRKEHNLSQEDLADELKVSRQAISKWESGTSYPEMEKILQICNKFNLNINDLLNNDIKEVKEETEYKNNINKYIDDFLNFISDSIELFTSLKFKDKIKFIIEQLFIIGILIILFTIFGYIISNLFSNISRIIPSHIYYFTVGFIKDAIYVLSIVLGIIIMLHLFKTRYLKYYKKKINDEDVNEIILNKEKIIIREPIENEYKFVNGLLKFITLSIRIFALFILAFVSSMLAFQVVMFVASFLISNTGLFFIGILTSLTGSITITVIITLILINFIFNRKNNKRLLVILFISSLLVSGVGVGLSFIGTLDFEIANSYKSELFISNEIEIDMDQKLMINLDGVELVEDSRDNLKIEYKVNKYSDASYEIYENEEYNNLYINTKNYQGFKAIKNYIKNINDKKILVNNNERAIIVKIYGSIENIEVLKNNYEKNIR